MLTISLHRIAIRAPHGLYPEEAVTGNDFEIDVDIRVPVNDGEAWPFIDYSLVSETVHRVFNGLPVALLETLVHEVHAALKILSPAGTLIRVAVRKLHPPMPGNVGWAQVCWED